MLQRAGAVLVVTHDPVSLRARPRLFELRLGGSDWVDGGPDRARLLRAWPGTASGLSSDRHVDTACATPATSRRCCWIAPRTVPSATLAARAARWPSHTGTAVLGLLSGGKCMRVAIAAAAWARPTAPLLLLDAPASHLDLDSVDARVTL